MKTLNLIQGSPEWIAHRATHFNASDAPAMMGVSPYKTRSQLLQELATGIVPEVDAATQLRFDDGHKFEAMARPLAEEIIGEPLSPVTGVDNEYSASFDGITFLEDIAFEHKSLNDDLRAAIRQQDGNANNFLAPAYKIQMEQQCMVSGCKRILFMASKWDNNGELVEERHCWYTPDMELRKQIIAGWEQFAIDLENYQHTEKQAEAVGRAPDALPALRIEVTGMVTASNLAEFKATALAVFKGINTNLQTDQDFADAEKAVKFCKDAEERLDAAKQHALSQTASIDELFRTVDGIKEEARTVRLKLEKLVKAEKENRKAEIINSATHEIIAHHENLEKRIGGRWLPVPRTGLIVEAVRGLKSLDSMRDKVSTALANAKIEANEIADRIEANLKSVPADKLFMFPDFAQVCTKPYDDFAALVAMRINQHKEAEAKRLEVEREKIRQEEQAKAEAKAKAEQEAKAKEDQKANAIVPPPSPADVVHAAAPVAIAEAIDPRPAVLHTAPAVKQDQPKRPTRAEIIATVAVQYGVSEQTAHGWLCDEFQQQAA